MLSQCAFCSGDIEYGEEYAGTWTECPHCSKKTPLARPQRFDKPAEPVNWKRRLRTTIFIGAPILIIAVAAVFIALIAPRLQRYAVGWGVFQQVAVSILVLVLAVIAVLIAVAWLLFPLLVWDGLKDIIREQRKTNELLKK